MDGNVFVKYLSPTIDDSYLYALFIPFGPILSAKVMVNTSSGMSLGYGFVRFASKADACKAILCMAGAKVLNKTLLCKLSHNFALTDPSTNLYLKPLPPDFTEEQLLSLFGKYGTIINAKIKRCPLIDDNNVGFVRYAELRSATEAIHKLNGFKVQGQAHLLMVRYAESDRQRTTRRSTAPISAHTPPPEASNPTDYHEQFDDSTVLFQTVVPEVEPQWGHTGPLSEPYYPYHGRTPIAG